MNGENLQSLEKAESVLITIQSVVDNQHQQKSEVIYTFTSNKSYAYLVNVEPSNLVNLKIFSIAFDDIKEFKI